MACTGISEKEPGRRGSLLLNKEAIAEQILLLPHPQTIRDSGWHGTLFSCCQWLFLSEFNNAQLLKLKRLRILTINYHKSGQMRKREATHPSKQCSQSSTHCPKKESFQLNGERLLGSMGWRLKAETKHFFPFPVHSPRNSQMLLLIISELRCFGHNNLWKHQHYYSTSRKS